jgi:sulfoquinovosyltransferase
MFSNLLGATRGPHSRPANVAHLAAPLVFSLQGMLKGEDLSAAYASADVFVMPSESETLGFVAMEVCSMCSFSPQQA